MSQPRNIYSIGAIMDNLEALKPDRFGGIFNIDARDDGVGFFYKQGGWTRGTILPADSVVFQNGNMFELFLGQWVESVAPHRRLELSLVFAKNAARDQQKKPTARTSPAARR